MTEPLRSVLLGTAGLAGAAVAALVLTLARSGVDADEARLRTAVRTAAVAVALQAAHFVEELATGFPRRFPELLGLAPWSGRFFIAFNLAWLAVWAVSLRGSATRRHVALFPLWFLGIAGVVNGVGHPLLAARTGGYFPGLVTAPFVGVAGLLLLRAMLAITDARRGA